MFASHTLARVGGEEKLFSRWMLALFPCVVLLLNTPAVRGGEISCPFIIDSETLPENLRPGLNGFMSVYTQRLRLVTGGSLEFRQPKKETIPTCGAPELETDDEDLMLPGEAEPFEREWLLPLRFEPKGEV